MEKINIITSSRELALKWVSVSFKSYLETLQEHLLRQAERADNNADQTRYFQTRDEINSHQNPLRQLYLQHIQQAFDHYRHHRYTATDYGSEFSMQQQLTNEQEEQTLSLINKDELEEKLAIGAMSRKIGADCSELLYALNQRLSVLSEGQKITNHCNPVAPAVFGEGLQQALAELTLDKQSRILIYKLFESVFMINIHKLYELINHHLEKHGILPHLSYHVEKSQTAQITEQLPDELTQQASSTSLTNQRNLIEAIRLLQARLQPQPRYFAPQAARHTLPAAQIIASIQQLQLNAGSLLNALETPQAVGNSNHQYLRQQAELEIQKTDDVGSHIIEIVGLLFEYMLNDDQLPDAVKALLSYLHTPFLKIAILDKSFFDRPEHPARQLLNSLVAAGERWVEPSGKHKNEVFQQIKNIVQRLLNEFDNEVRLFSELAFEFNHYLRQHAHRIQLTEKRAKQAAQGENKLKEIRLKVNGYLKQKTSNIQLPPSIETLLFEPWSNFLSFNLLRFGSGSEQWREASQTVDDIIWFCQAHDPNNLAANKRMQELKQLLPGALQAGFNTVGYDGVQGEKLLAALLQPQSTTGSPVPTLVTTDIDNVDISAGLGILPQNTTIIERLKRTKLDTWFEFNANSSDPQRVKLTWTNTDTLHFMFVNRMGQQVAVKTGAELAKEINRGDSKILQTLEQKPFFEKAMERVLEQLRQREQNIRD